jgi:hypothetical protein
MILLNMRPARHGGAFVARAAFYDKGIAYSEKNTPGRHCQAAVYIVQATFKLNLGSPTQSFGQLH